MREMHCKFPREQICLSAAIDKLFVYAGGPLQQTLSRQVNNFGEWNAISPCPDYCTLLTSDARQQ